MNDVSTITTAPAPAETTAPAAVKAPKPASGKEFTVQRDLLVDAVAKASRATAKIGALSTVRLHFGNSRLTVSGSDLELGVATKIPVTGRSGATVNVDTRLLGKVLAAVTAETVEITVTAARVTISADGFVTRLRCQDDEGWAMLQTPDAELVTVNAVEFLQGAAAASPAVSTDDNRPILTGVFLHNHGGRLHFAGTDSFRLAVAATPIVPPSDDMSIIVPRRALVELSRMVGDADEIEWCFDERSVMFRVGDRMVVSRLIEGEYPKFRGLVPAKVTKLPTQLTFSRVDALVAVRQVALLADDVNNMVQLTATAKMVKMVGVSTEGADEIGDATAKVAASLDGDPVTVAFNATFLAAGLASFDDDEVTLSIDDSMKPAVLHAGKPAEHLYLIMPVRAS